MWGGQDDAGSIAAIHAAVDRGVNWIDTAPIYGSGHSEAMVGKALAALPASRRPLVFTKFGLGDSSDVNTRAASRANVIAECDASLRRLGVDRIDLYQLHWPAPEPIAETAAACDELVRAGKIRAIGVSNFSVAQLDEWRATGVPLHSLQTPYSILRPAPRTELLPWCVRHGVGVIAYSPLFRGLLFGTWTKDKTFPAGEARGAHKDYAGPCFQRHLQAVKQLRARFARCMDTKDWDGMRATIAADCVFDAGQEANVEELWHGPADIVANIRRNLASATSVHHAHMPEITITSPTTATGIWAMQDLLRWAGPPPVEKTGRPERPSSR